jgi:hypothetical protein
MIKVENHNMPEQHARGLINTLQAVYKAELNMCILNDVDTPCFFREIGWIGAEGDPRSVGLLYDNMYESMKETLDRYGPEEQDVPGAYEARYGAYEARYGDEEQDEPLGDPTAPLSEAQQRALQDMFAAMGWQQQ